MTTSQPHKFFVYGTLKRGECREHAWPHPPLSVHAATTFGRLFDLGHYPAMVRGDDQVVGELWCIAEEFVEATLHVLDAIEDYDPHSDNNLYERHIIECHDEAAVVHSAWTYFYVPTLPEISKSWILPDEAGNVVWRS